MISRFLLMLAGLLLIDGFTWAQSPDGKFLAGWLKQQPELKQVVDKRKQYEIQIIYSQINRDAANVPNFTTYHFNVDTNRYFYPASTVKFPMVLLALEKLNRLNIPEVNMNTTVYYDSVFSGQRRQRADTTTEGGVPTLGHFAKRVFVVSDNHGYNRLYEFVGQREANTALQQKGYNLRILHRLDRPLSPKQNRATEPVTFMQGDRVLHHQPMLVNDSIPVRKKFVKGRGYYSNGALVRKPMDFSYRNYFHLADQHEMLKAVLFPSAVPEKKRFNLSSVQHRWVLKHMSQLPAETIYPPYYRDSVYRDNYVKPLWFEGDSVAIPSHIRIFNKIGTAYGFMIDNAYIVDFKEGIEFMLSVVIYTNKDQIFNDDKYEYETVAMPFLKNLGKAFYELEKARPKKYKPDLSEFKFEYDLKR